MNTTMLTRLREKKPHPGTWLSIGSSLISELAAESGFDWLLFDLEHGCATDTALFGQLQAIRGTNTAAIVRVGAPHPDLILRVLDWGADGLMIPHVSSAEEAAACVQAALYPPAGRRGLSRSARAYSYGLRPPGTPESMNSPFIMAQIESIEGVEHARAIAAVHGIDVLFVGPADLGFDLDARPEFVTRDYDACLREVVAAAAAAGKQSGILIRSAEEFAKFRDLGFTLIAIDSDIAIMRNAYQSILTSVESLK
jgi:2-keto-3-deoxy-L-rhamnonate aldolase RhmA